jgi:hypothetical protein
VTNDNKIHKTIENIARYELQKDRFFPEHTPAAIAGSVSAYLGTGEYFDRNGVSLVAA